MIWSTVYGPQNVGKISNPCKELHLPFFLVFSVLIAASTLQKPFPGVGISSSYF